MSSLTDKFSFSLSLMLRHDWMLSCMFHKNHPSSASVFSPHGLERTLDCSFVTNTGGALTSINDWVAGFS